MAQLFGAIVAVISVVEFRFHRRNAVADLWKLQEVDVTELQ